MAEDFELLDAWANGDAAAARELLQRYTGPLVRFFGGKVDGPVEDLVQEAMMACVSGRDRFRREGGFRCYVFGIARNLLYAHLRQRKRAPGELDPESSCLHEIGPTPSEVIVRKKEERLLLEALRHLPIETQLMLELYYWQGLSGAEVAAVHGIGEPTLRSRLLRAKAALREIIERLAESPALMHSTWADFEGWAKALPKLGDATDDG